MKRSSGNSEKSSQPDRILDRAEKLREKSRYRQAYRLFSEALKRYTQSRDQEGMFQCMLSLGDTSRMTGDFDLAAGSYADAIRTARAMKAPAMIADAQIGLGLSFRAQGKWREALRLIHESEKAYRQRNDSHGIAFALWSAAGTLRVKGDIPEALKTYKASYRIFQSLKDTQGSGYCLCGLGGSSRIAGLFGESLRYYRDANRLFTGIHDTFGRAYSHCGIGNAYRMLKDYHHAFAHFRKAVRLYEKMGDKVSYAYTLWGLSEAYKLNGRFCSAREYLGRALRLFRKTQDPRGIIYCRLGLGEISLIEGRKTLARRHLVEARSDAARYSFAVEKCHAETLLSFIADDLKKSSGRALRKNKTEKYSGKIDNTCYNRLGLKLRFQALPLNIP
jgi:tetratricopeptide (TPR) repeat protein